MFIPSGLDYFQALRYFVSPGWIGRLGGWVRIVAVCAVLLLFSAAARASTGTVLYSQPTNAAGGYISQNSPGPVNFVPATAYDNFSLSNDSVINEIAWTGEHVLGTPIISAFTVQIYTDNLGAPGSSIFNTTVTNFHETPLGIDALGVPYFSYDATGFSTPMLTAGTQYWLSIVANTASAPPLWDWGLGSGGNGSFFYKFPDGSTTTRPADLAFTLYSGGCQATAIGQPVAPGVQFIGTVDPFSGGPFSLDGKPVGEYAIFAPGTDPNGSNPLSLQAAANVCGFARFNWQQTITNLPARSDPSKCTLGGPFDSPPTQPLCLAATSNPTVVLTAGPPPTGPSFLDPVPGGYTYELPQGDDAYPFYYTQAQLTSGCIDDFNGMPGCVPIEDPNVNSIGGVLLFEDRPANPLLPPGQYANYTTSLVGIRQDGSTASLFSWSWKTNFDGTTLGGVAKNLLLPDPGSGTGGVTITSINGVLQTPPSVTCIGTPNILWPPNGKSVEVTMAGAITPGTQIIPTGGTEFAVTDKYGQVQPTGSITLGPGGDYSFAVPLIAARNGNDLDGRIYTIVVRAVDSISNIGSCSTTVSVPHDQGR